VAKVNVKLFIFTVMPGDTLFFSNDTVYFLNAQGDTIHSIGVSGRTVEDSRTKPSEGWSIAFPFIIMAIVFIIPLFIKWARRGVNKQIARQVFMDKHVVYSSMLDRFNPYYHSLPDGLKKRFLKRTLNFMTSKRFRYMEMEGEEHMPLLVSATAIQLTFGLNHYLLDHFHTIYILKSDYNYGLFSVPFQGHVNKDGIYLSWSNFVRAFEDYSDGDNVGLHEMAHALSYVNFIANDGEDDGFKQRFREFSKTGRPVFQEVQEGRITLLGNYAATNYEEFWAVCVENFFERPAPFREQLPALYNAMCNLLNQDMLAPGLFVIPTESFKGQVLAT
jgi:Mlc titration factor MtfA (ptsG expression regulator)